MNKSVMRSIKPYWLYLILKGIKPIEVGKNEPKSADWNKIVHLYCSKDKKSFNRIPQEDREWFSQFIGKVTCEFVCDKIEEIRCCVVPYLQENNLGYEHFIDNGVYKFEGTDKYNKDGGVIFERQDSYIDTMLKNDDFNKMCLTPKEVFDYINGFGNKLYNWHISALKIYDKPKELSEFYNYKKFNWYDYSGINKPTYEQHYLEKPFQSWGYVEELEK